MSTGNRLGGARFDRLYQHGLEWFQENWDAVQLKLNADGYPPGTVPLTPQEQIKRLSEWRDTNDPRYWSDPKAREALVSLLARYGPQAQPYGYPVTTFPAPDLPPQVM